MREGIARAVRPACWKVVPGVVWIQVHEPGQARALKRIRGSRRVAYGVAGRYLRTFEFARPLRWAQRWIERRMARESGTNRGFSPLAGAQARRTDGRMSREPMVRATRQRAKQRLFRAKVTIRVHRATPRNRGVNEKTVFQAYALPCEGVYDLWLEGCIVGWSDEEQEIDECAHHF